jgi:hypothetical protein
MRLRTDSAIIVLNVLMISPSLAAPKDSELPMVLDVLERTKTTDATYSLYMWNRITLPGQDPVQEWSAEFHSGHLHRVETPRDRVVADCLSRTGFALSVLTGKISEGPSVANAACGINTNKRFLAAEWKGVVQTPFGKADRVRVVDQDNIREYDVSEEGILFRTTYTENEVGERLLLVVQAVNVVGILPNPDMFDAKSLSKSFVPEQYKIAPTADSQKR